MWNILEMLTIHVTVTFGLQIAMGLWRKRVVLNEMLYLENIATLKVSEFPMQISSQTTKLLLYKQMN